MHRINKITFNRVNIIFYRVNIIFYRMVDQTQTSIARKRQSGKKRTSCLGWVVIHQSTFTKKTLSILLNQECTTQYSKCNVSTCSAVAN